MTRWIDGMAFSTFNEGEKLLGQVVRNHIAGCELFEATVDARKAAESADGEAARAARDRVMTARCVCPYFEAFDCKASGYNPSQQLPPPKSLGTFPDLAAAKKAVEAVCAPAGALR